MNKEGLSPSRLVRYDSVIRLTLYRAAGEEAQTGVDERFVSDWQELAATPIPGVIYRELCRQVPEWSAQVSAEMEHPIDAAFLEYMVVEAGTDLAAIPALKARLEGRYTITQDIHTVAFRFVKETAERPGALMFNLFEIDGAAGMEQGFLMDWPPRGEFKIGESATLSTMLHQRMLTGAKIKAFNRAEVVSAEAYAEGIERFEKAFPRGARKAAAGPMAAGAKAPIRSHLGLFEIAGVGAVEAPAARPTMRAVTVDGYGGPEVLVPREVPRPNPGPGQVRVRVRASAINPLDVKMRSGEVRHIYPSWFPDVLGYSVSGVVDAIGEGVSDRALGEEVYGINNPIMRHGYAEFVVGASRFFYPKPARMDFATASAAPSIFATAYGGLFLRANLQSGQTVLIHGGSGVIGSCAVQLAKQAGARVIATASTANVARVLALGADIVVDYKTQRFEDFAKEVDLVLDTVGGETRERSWPLIRKGGTLASLLPPPPDQETAEQYGVKAFMVHGHPDIAEIMPEMTRRLDAGELAFPEIAATYSLETAAEAHRVFESSSPRGRLVLVIED